MDAEAAKQAEIIRLTKRLEGEKNAILLHRSICKWVLELVRNCMVVAALAYLARRSGDWWMYGIVGLSAFALVGYCNSYIHDAVFDLNMKGLSKRIFWPIWFAAELTTLAVIVGLYATIDRIVTIQGLRP